MENKADHDVQVENSVLLKALIKNFENHLRHHWAVTFLALSAGVIGAANLCVGLIIMLVKG